jgi:hypothetical protein
MALFFAVIFCGVWERILDCFALSLGLQLNEWSGFVCGIFPLDEDFLGDRVGLRIGRKD